jgi:hypothetical protein
MGTLCDGVQGHFARNAIMALVGGRSSNNDMAEVKMTCDSGNNNCCEWNLWAKERLYTMTKY